MPVLKNGMARVEFHAVKPEVEDLLAKGYPIIAVYRLLKENGKISMCFGAFKRHLRRLRRSSTPKTEARGTSQVSPAKFGVSETARKEPKPVSASAAKTSNPAAQSRGPILVRAEQKGFGQDKISLEDLI